MKSLKKGEMNMVKKIIALSLAVALSLTIGNVYGNG